MCGMLQDDEENKQQAGDSHHRQSDHRSAKLFKLTTKQKVLFNKATAIIWLLLILPAYLWWKDTVFFVIVCSIYANVKADWSTAEASDDRQLKEMLQSIRAQNNRIIVELNRLNERLDHESLSAPDSSSSP